ncbi:hypothetical protein D3C79_656530 [compost metagenome]
MGLLGREVDVGQAGLGLDRFARLGQCRALGQRGGDLGGDGFGFAAAEIANQRDDRVAGRVGLGMEGAQLLLGDCGDALGSAVARVGVGVLAIEFTEQGLAGDLAGVLFLVLETGQQLVLDAFEGVFRESRLAGHFGEQLECRFALVLGAQAAQRGHGHVAVGTIAEIRTEAFEALGDGGDVLASDPFIEHRVGQRRQARGIAVLATACGVGHAQVEHRQLAGFDEQHAGAFGSGPVLDVQLASARCLAVQFGQ